VCSQGPRRYNFILDDAARQRYAPVLAFLHSLAPEIMARKIERANIQQAFVFDAVRALASADAKILCVGSFEDTACIALKMIGVGAEEIDPVINYDLDEFVGRPSTVKQSYDVVFATSVLEHVEDDEKFMRLLSEMLKPNGVMILTCDYNDQYKPGDEIPTVCHRMYTQRDFRERVIPSAPQCFPIDNPDWDCPNPDFVLGNRFRYTFATLVLRKSAS
jgi:SAM-dependent methyltransferase